MFGFLHVNSYRKCKSGRSAKFRYSHWLFFCFSQQTKRAVVSANYVTAISIIIQKFQNNSYSSVIF